MNRMRPAHRKLIERVLKAIRNYDMLRPGDRVLVAVSGGPDSVFLLHALDYLKKKLRIEVSACNLDHGLRGPESERDSYFVERLAQVSRLPFLHKKITLRAVREKGLSIEESGRAERYRFYRECAERLDANVVATGHTLDDQAETVLMRLIKGSSLKGACGIPPVRTETQDLKVIRPLIELEKREIVDYLKESGIDFCVDATNAEPEYFRNAVRHEVIPYLEKFNPRIKKALFNFAAHLREDFAFIQAEKARQASRIISKRGDRISLSLKDIVVQPKALVKEIVRDALNEIGAEIKKLSYAHWKEIDHFIRAKRKGKSIDLPGGIRMMRDESALHLFRLAKAAREGARLKT